MCDLTNIVRILQAMCRRVGTPRALTVSLLIEAGEWEQLTRLSVNPYDYQKPEDFARDQLVTEWLRKFEGLPAGLDLHASAVESFQKAEVDCFWTNERLSPFLAGLGLTEQENLIRPFISKVRQEIREILGPLPKRLNGRHGPGATYSDKGKQATVPDKFSSVPTLTPSVSSLLGFWDDRWCKINNERGGRLNYVRGNRFTSVPKDSRKKRGICIEPSLNVWFQLDVGSALRKRLKEKRGLDLDEGQVEHRLLACNGSLHEGSWSTIDLSSASDTVAYNLVKLLLPYEWFSLLDSLRSPYTEIGGKWVKLEKFSSMGNGYTFELETLLFFAIVKVASGGDYVKVYGDDIIVNQKHEREVLSALRYFGFTPNPKKTFFHGLFRESCGGDFMDGVNVRAPYLKGAPDSPPAWISLLNSLMRWVGNDPLRWAVVKDAWHIGLAQIPTCYRFFGPEALGDVVIHPPLGADDRRTAWERDGITWWKCLLPISRKRVGFKYFTPDVVMAAILYGAAADSRGFVPRDPVEGFKIGRVAYS